MSYFIHASSVESKILQQNTMKDIFRKHNQSAKQTGSMWWETDNVIPDRKQQTDTMSQPNGITV